MASNLQTNQSNSTELRPTGLATPLTYRQRLSPQEIIAQNAVDAVGLQKYQFISDNPKFYMCIGVQKYARINAMQIAKGNSLAQIILPMPMQLGDTQQVEYTPTDLGFTGAVAVGAGAAAFNALTGRDTSMGGQEPYSSALGMAAGGVIGGLLSAAGAGFNAATGADISSTASAITGLSVNNFQVLLLRGPTYKRHEFTWKLSPKNFRESKNLKNMVADVNNWMAPGIELAGALFTFPAVFNIEFSHPEFLYRFKPSVCTSCSVNYYGSGVPAFHKDGEPESIILRMSFWELEYWLAGQHARNDFYTAGVLTPNMTNFSNSESVRRRSSPT
jgi:hypothetical protein